MNSADTIVTSLNGGSINISAGSINAGTLAAIDGVTLNATGGGINVADVVSLGAINLNASGGISTRRLVTGGNIDVAGIPLSLGVTNASDITLTSNNNITTGSINASAEFGNAGNVTLTSRNGGILIDPARGEGSVTVDGDIVAADGAIIAGTTGSGGRGGNITLSAPGDIVTGSLLSGSTEGIGGAIRVSSSLGSVNTSLGNIRLNGSTVFDRGVLFSAGFNGGGEISLRANGSVATGAVVSGSLAGNGGNFIAEGNGVVFTGEVVSASLNGNGGNVNISSSTSNVNSLFINAQGIRSGTGGDVNIRASGTFQAENSINSVFQPLFPTLLNSAEVPLELDRESSISTSGAINGGNVFVQAGTAITTGAINTEGRVGSGGNVTLDPSGDIQVRWINAQGGVNGQGGDVDITTGQFFRATDTFIDRNGILASISTAGGQGGGDITIRHGGNGLVPFIAGDVSLNGTAGAITSGEFSIEPTRVMPFTTFVGNIEVISVDPSFNLLLDLLSRDALLSLLDLGQLSVLLDIDILEELESILSEEFETYLEQEASIKTLADARRSMREVEEATGVKPAIIYAIYIPGVFISPKSLLPERGTKYLDSSGNSAPNQLIWEFPALGQFKPTAAPSSSAPLSSSSLAKAPRPINPDDRLLLILVTAEGDVVRHIVPGLTRQQIDQAATQFRNRINGSSSGSGLRDGQQFYRLLVEPLEAELQQREIENLVFILDRGLRSIPLAAMHDGTGYIVERYSVGLMPTLSYTDTQYRDIRAMDALVMGTKDFPGQDQTPLPAVPLEVKTIGETIWDGEAFLGRQFTLNTLKQSRKRRPFGILHLATHGEFLPGQPNRSYIQFHDEKLLFSEVRQQLRLANPPIELLVLSACKTAIGDFQEELGFAGFAVSTGVKTAMGSLWYVSDDATLGLMTNFYENLREAPIKAEALRRAQVAMLKGEIRLQDGFLVTPQGHYPLPPELAAAGDRDLRHPYYWSGFTLVGNPW